MLQSPPRDKNDEQQPDFFASGMTIKVGEGTFGKDSPIHQAKIQFFSREKDHNFPWKFNSFSPENKPSQKENYLETIIFQGKTRC